MKALKGSLDSKTEEEYNKIPAIRSSHLKIAYKESPKHFRNAEIGESERKETKAMRTGSLTHLLLLEPEDFQQNVVVMPNFEPIKEKVPQKRDPTKFTEKTLKTKKAQVEEWTAANQGKKICTESEFELVTGLKSAFDLEENQKIFKPFFTNHMVEHTIVWRDEETGLMLKVRLDIFRKGAFVGDIKTTVNANPEKFKREAKYNYMYDLSAAMYLEAYKAKYGEELPWYLFVMENKEPFDMYPAKCSYNSEFISIGRDKFRYALDLISNSRLQNKYPGYNQGPCIIFD